MDLQNLLTFLNQTIDSIVQTSPDQVIEYVDNLRLNNSNLSSKKIAEKILSKQSMKNGLLGAGTGVAGLLALPVTLPADVVKAWKIQAFTISCIAYVYGYTDQTSEIKTDIYLLLANNSVSELEQMVAAAAVGQISKGAEGIKETVTRGAIKVAPQYAAKAVVKCAGKKAADYTMQGIPKHLTKVLWRVGGRKIVEKSLQKSFTKVVPVIGAVTGFGFDWFSTQAIGKLAIEFYENRPNLMKPLV